jgi:hypothetical protein
VLLDDTELITWRHSPEEFVRKPANEIVKRLNKKRGTVVFHQLQSHSESLN